MYSYEEYDAWIENLIKARARQQELGAYPRPWRSEEEGLMVRRLVLQWHICRDRSKPSARAWAKQLGVTHVWLLKLVRKFEEDPAEVYRLHAYGDPTLEQLNRAKQYTELMRSRGELRSPCRRVPLAIEPAMERFVRERFAQGWNKSRLARELFLDRRTVKRILQKSISSAGRALARLPSKGQKNGSGATSPHVEPTTRKLAGPLNTSAFVGSNPTGELITSRLPVIREPRDRFSQADSRH